MRVCVCACVRVPTRASLSPCSVAHDATLLAAANDFGSVFVWRLGGASDAERSKKFEPLQKLQAHSTYITKCLILSLIHI